MTTTTTARTYAEELLAGLLEQRGIQFSEQQEFAGHKIDFTLHFPDRDVQLDVNGDRWHHWKKIVDCDRVKLNRVLNKGGVPVAVWLSRLQKDPSSTLDTLAALGAGPLRLPWWDWAVNPRSLTPENHEWVDHLLQTKEK